MYLSEKEEKEKKVIIRFQYQIYEPLELVWWRRAGVGSPRASSRDCSSKRILYISAELEGIFLCLYAKKERTKRKKNNTKILGQIFFCLKPETDCGERSWADIFICRTMWRALAVCIQLLPLSLGSTRLALASFEMEYKIKTNETIANESFRRGSLINRINCFPFNHIYIVSSLGGRRARRHKRRARASKKKSAA
jgi:hypothetical protein